MTVPLVLRTKITPPTVTGRTLARPRVVDELLESIYNRLTLLQAGAGYGKSTALAALAETGTPLIWYQTTKDDNDLLVFLLHLCHAARLAMPALDGLPIPRLESWEVNSGALPVREVIFEYLNALSAGLTAPALLVLDDVHLIVDNPEIVHILDQLVNLAPPHLHLLFSSRLPITLPNLGRLEARGEVRTLHQSVLAFTPEEICDLFDQHYDYALTDEETRVLSAITEGWAITLQLIWQNLRSGTIRSIKELLSRQDAPLENLFEALTHDVLAQQPEDVQHFLRATSVLRVLFPGACDSVLESGGSLAMLAYLHRRDFFVVEVGGEAPSEPVLRYHYIFHRFLRQQSTAAERRQWHTRAGEYFRTSGDAANAIYHFLKAEDHESSAQLLSETGEHFLVTGRLDTLASYLDTLPPETLARHPNLLFFLGDLARLRSRFQEALGWYQGAEALWRERGQNGGIGRALRGQVRVYLDTVDPGRAEDLLQESLRLSDGTADREAQARLYELLAENKLNAGKPDEAEQLRNQATALRTEGPSDAQLLFRVLLRTGRVDEARQKLEVQAEAERAEPVQTPRAHRETLLLLAILYAFQGEAQAAFQAAIEGTQRGAALGSPFVTAVGHMRQGHALMLLPGENRYTESRAHFEKAIEIGQDLAVPRLRVEAFWGLCRSYGYQGDLARAQQMAAQGIELANQFGDEWVASLTRLSMGASLILAGREELAGEWLNRARRGFDECSDPLGGTVSQLLLCLGWFRAGEEERLAQALPAVLSAGQKNDYDFLFTRPTLLGVPDERMLVPMLIQARDRGWEAGYARQLLTAIGLPEIRLHPGYQLRVHTLGSFRASLGDHPVHSNGWRRAATRQLWQVLITFRNAPLDREQIFEFLWPGAEPDFARRNFKVALNTLYKVLEPDRAPSAESAYILREGSVYGLRPEADLWIDAEEFSKKVWKAEARKTDADGSPLPLLEEVVDLYRGEYLPEARYEAWAIAEQEHLAVQFLQSADRLCGLYLEKSRVEDAVQLAQRILAEDPCWERAYRYLMQAYDRLGDRGQVARTYRRCVEVLSKELDVAPSPETGQLYKALTGAQ